MPLHFESYGHGHPLIILHGLFGSLENDAIFAALFSLDGRGLRSRQQADTALAGKIPDLALRQFLLKNLEREAPGGFRWRINLDAIHKNYAEILKGLEGTGQFHHPT